MESLAALQVAEVEFEVMRFFEISGRKHIEARHLPLPNNDNESHDDASICGGSVMHQLY